MAGLKRRVSLRLSATPFIVKIITVLQGIAYIHDSLLGFHGYLKSTNCLVDSRWVLKISSYGLQCFSKSQDKKEDQGEYALYKGKYGEVGHYYRCL